MVSNHSRSISLDPSDHREKGQGSGSFLQQLPVVSALPGGCRGHEGTPPGGDTTLLTLFSLHTCAVQLGSH